MSARPTDVLYDVTLADHADMEHESDAPATPQELFDAALRDLLRYRTAERFHRSEAARLANLAHYAEVRIEIAIADGAAPCEVFRG